MTNTIKTFLICHRGALGDFILTWPAIQLLRKHFPEYKFIGLGRPEYMKLAVKLGILEEFHNVESACMLDFFENGMIPEFLGKPEKGILWLKDAGETAELLKKNSNCCFAPIAPFPVEKMHVAKFHVREILKYLKIKDSFEPVDLIPEPYFPAKNIILIHPGSGSSKKNYSPEFYLEAAKFAEEHFKTEVKFILGPVEIEKGMGNFFPADKTLTPGNASALADILSGTRLFIGNDSGVGHLAGFLGVPTIILYKNTDPEIWGVVGRETAYLINPLEGTALINLKDFFISGNIF
ncbi:MAG: glycosyltransferase family 9 protein [Victivallales bacterium]